MPTSTGTYIIHTGEPVTICKTCDYAVESCRCDPYKD